MAGGGGATGGAGGVACTVLGTPAGGGAASGTPPPAAADVIGGVCTCCGEDGTDAVDGGDATGAAVAGGAPAGLNAWPPLDDVAADVAPLAASGVACEKPCAAPDMKSCVGLIGPADDIPLPDDPRPDSPPSRPPGLLRADGALGADIPPPAVLICGSDDTPVAGVDGAPVDGTPMLLGVPDWSAVLLSGSRFVAFSDCCCSPGCRSVARSAFCSGGLFVAFSAGF